MTPPGTPLAPPSRYRGLVALDEFICPSHGWLRHVGVHEAGHAVVALALGFEFIELSITPGQQLIDQITGGAPGIAGGVLMHTNQPTEWVGPRPDDALVYLLAGSVAERRALGHHLDGRSRGDLETCVEELATSIHGGAILRRY